MGNARVGLFEVDENVLRIGQMSHDCARHLRRHKISGSVDIRAKPTKADGVGGLAAAVFLIEIDRRNQRRKRPV